MATQLNYKAILRLLSRAVAMLQATIFTTTIKVMTLFDISTANSPSLNPIKVRVCAIQNANR